MSGTGPAVSVLLPVHNGEVFLGRALASIRRQTLTDLEIVAVDDGSTDGTAAILDRHAAEDPRIHVLRSAHRGIVTALNAGLQSCRAALVARMDADDVARPDRLERQVEFLDRHPTVAVVGGAIRFVDAAGRGGAVLRYPTDPIRAREQGRTNPPVAHPAVVMRRDVVLALGGYRKVFEFAEDYDLWLRVIEAHEISNLDDIVLLHRVHADQISGRRGAQQALAARFARISAAFRRSGRRDPFDDIPKIVPSLAATLGLHPVERRRVAALMTAALMEDRGRKGRPLTSERAAAILRRHLARVLRAPSPDRRPGPVPRPPPASRETGLRTCSPPSP